MRKCSKVCHFEVFCHSILAQIQGKPNKPRSHRRICVARYGVRTCNLWPWDTAASICVASTLMARATEDMTKILPQWHMLWLHWLTTVRVRRISVVSWWVSYTHMLTHDTCNTIVFVSNNIHPIIFQVTTIIQKYLPHNRVRHEEYVFSNFVEKYRIITWLQLAKSIHWITDHSTLFYPEACLRTKNLFGASWLICIIHTYTIRKDCRYESVIFKWFNTPYILTHV